MLTNIFNAYYSIGLFPSAFQKSTIKFIPKNGKDPKHPLDYRPISLLELRGKIFEKKRFKTD